MGRDDAVNVHTTREQIYPRSTREHIVAPIIIILYHIRQDFSSTSQCLKTKSGFTANDFHGESTDNGSYAICMLAFPYLWLDKNVPYSSP